MTDTLLERRARFLHEPRTEQEVVCLFGALLDEVESFLGFPFVIETVRTPFPDAIIQRVDTGDRIHVEFELYASRFCHDVDQCKLLVCWFDDKGAWPATLQVVELADLAAGRPDLIASIDTRDPSRPWDGRGFFKRASADGATMRDIVLCRRIIDFAQRERLGPQWLVSPSAVFAVGDGAQFFKVYSTGRIGFPLFTRLSELFDTDERLDRFLGVWKWFRDAKGHA